MASAQRRNHRQAIHRSQRSRTDSGGGTRLGENAIPGPDFDIWELKAIKQPSLERRSNHRVTLFTPQPDTGWITGQSQADFVLRYGHVSGTDENGNPDEYYFTSGDINRPGEDKEGAKLNLKLVGFTDAKHFDPNGMIALYDKQTGELAAGWSYLKLLEHWQRKHNRAAYVPYLREKEDGKTTVEFGPLVTLGISTSFGLFLKAFQDGKVIYDPGDKITLKDGKWTPHSRSQFRINLNDISAIVPRSKRSGSARFRFFAKRGIAMAMIMCPGCGTSIPTKRCPARNVVCRRRSESSDFSTSSL